MNPLDAICNVKRNDAVCVSNLKSSRRIDKALLQERPDVKIFLPFRFHFYKPKDLFKENTYKNFLGKKKFHKTNNSSINTSRHAILNSLIILFTIKKYDTIFLLCYDNIM